MPSLLRLFSVSLLSACASEVHEYGTGPESLDNGGSSAAAGGSGAEGKGGTGAKGGTGGGTAGKSGAGGGTSGLGGGTSGAGSQGTAGSSGSGGSSGSSEASAGSPAGGSESGAGGAGDGACDEASAELLSTMQSLVTVDADACLKIEFNADQQEWVQAVTMQPSAGTYPFSFSWSNCGAQGSGAFGANYGNQLLAPVDPSCAVLIKLTGPGQTIELQWWGS